MEKSRKQRKIKTLGILFTLLCLFGVASCNQSGENEQDALADRELVRDQGFDRATEGPENELDPENVGSFERWDMNEDGRWDRGEFERVLNDAPFYEKWDTNRDRSFSEEELNAGIFNLYDVNGDQILDENEFNNFTSAWIGDGANEYREWDTNNDNYLDGDEFNFGIYNAGIYDEWKEEHDGEKEDGPGVEVTNTSGIFGESQVEKGLFSVYDINSDGYITKEEYKLTQIEDFYKR